MEKELEQLLKRRESGTGRIMRQLYLRGEMTRADLQKELDLSKPTVLNTVKAMTAAGLVRSGHVLQSDKGRRPVTLVFQYEARQAVGIRVLPDRCELVLANLKLIVHARKTVFFPHTAAEEHSPAFFQRLREETDRFVQEQGVSPDRFCGLGIALEGEFDMVTWTSGGVTTVRGEVGQYFPYPVHLGQMYASTGYAELWNADPDPACCLVVGKELQLSLLARGGMLNGMIYPGGRIDHLTLYPGGRKCSCGRRGCVHAYCSVDVLTGSRFATLDDFFLALRSGDRPCAETWEQYLDALSQLISNLDMIFQWDMVLSGELSDWIRSDMELLKFFVAHKQGKKDHKRLRLGRYGSEGDALGAAMEALESSLAAVGTETE